MASLHRCIHCIGAQSRWPVPTQLSQHRRRRLSIVVAASPRAGEAGERLFDEAERAAEHVAQSGAGVGRSDHPELPEHNGRLRTGTCTVHAVSRLRLGFVCGMAVMVTHAFGLANTVVQLEAARRRSCFMWERGSAC